MTRLEAALLFVALWEVGGIVVLAVRIRDLERRPCTRVHWEPIYGPAGRGGGKVSTADQLRRQAAAALGVRLHDDGTVSEVIDVPPWRPHLEEGSVVELVRGVD